MVSTTTSPQADSQRETTLYENARAELIRWGLLMAAIYTVYLLFFPLFPTIDQNNRVLEIELLLREGRKWFAPFYILGLGLLFYAFWRQVKIVHELSRQDAGAARSLRGWVLGIGILCAVLLIGLYPITALDVALYVVRARLWALYGGSPMLAVPADFPQDPFIRLAGEYQKEVSPYGPLWELVAQIPIRLGIRSIGAGILAMKVISLLAYAGTAVLLGWAGRQDRSRSGVSHLTSMTFFALNPLVLMQAIGNGHNDMLMLALITLGLVLWQRDRWAWATLALTLATLIKVAGLVLLPLFAVAVLAAAPRWSTRLARGLGMALIFLVTASIAYGITGPFPRVFEGARHALFDRAGYTASFLVYVLSREFAPAASEFRAAIFSFSRGLFILYYIFLLLQLARGRMTLIQAGFLAYFSQLLLGATFRIWYPLWLIPFAALGLNSSSFWRTFLFGLTAELSILVYLILWRWKLDSWEWGLHGPLQAHWHYWTITTALTVPWLFGIPLLVPVLQRWRNRQRFDNSLAL